MLDAVTELDRLRNSLRLKNIPEHLVQDICVEASAEISDTVIDLISDAMSSAVNAGADVNSSDFIKEVMSIRRGQAFEVVTKSGREDFSEPPFPMLPKLLKNGKTAKDGSIFKVIPLKEKSSTSSLAVTTEEAFKSINSNRETLKEQRRARIKEGKAGSIDPFQGLDGIGPMLAASKSETKKISETQSGPVNFKTASSNQDANAKWVKPGKSADLTDKLVNINNDLQYSIDSAIEQIIRKYGDMY
jgi:hypothetical protein